MAEVMMQTNNLKKFFGSENFNPQKQASKKLDIIRKCFLRRDRWFLAQYLSQEMITEGGRQPQIRNFVWLLVP